MVIRATKTLRVGVMLYFSALQAMERTGSIDSSQLLWAYAIRQGDRSCMEDTLLIQVPLLEAHERTGIFIICDGHNGPQAAKITTHKLCELMRTHLFTYCQQSSLASFSKVHFDHMAFSALGKVESLLTESKPTISDAGTTVVLGLLIERVLYLAWVGDSRAFVVRKGTLVPGGETVDHAGSTATEIKRIVEARPHNYWTILSFILAHDFPTRMLGNADFKRSVDIWSAVPETKSILLEENDLIIFVTDGFTSRMKLQDTFACISRFEERYMPDGNQLETEYPEQPFNRVANHEEFVAEESNNERLKLLARFLRDTAYNRWSTDNISVMLIQFTKSLPA